MSFTGDFDNDVNDGYLCYRCYKYVDPSWDGSAEGIRRLCEECDWDKKRQDKEDEESEEE